MEQWNRYHKYFEAFLKEQLSFESETDIYEPIEYMLQIGGKRIRPTALILAIGAFEADPQKGLWAGAAIELFHNFSLIHDDIMDKSPLRRGKQTVHEKWDSNMAILSGDSCFAMAYKCLENYEPVLFKTLFKLFTQASLLVCEGQRMDILFEKPNTKVNLEQYLRMVELKTAILLAYSLQMGASIAGKNEKTQYLIYEFGKNLGIAFQIQDDYLDLFGDQNLVGKQKGNDLIYGKKTYLYLKVLENASPKNKKKLLDYFEHANDTTRQENLDDIKQIFDESQVRFHTKKAIEDYTTLALENIEELNLPEEKKDIFQTFGRDLMNRSY